MTLIATLSLGVLLIVVSTIQLALFKARMSQVLASQQLTLVSRVADEIDQALMMRLTMLVGVAKILPALDLARPAVMRRNLEGRPALRSQFEAISVIAANGTIVAAVPYDKRRETINLSDRPWIRSVLDGGQPIVSPPHRARTSGEPQVILAAPVFGADGKVIGALAGTLYLFRPNFLGNIARTSVGERGSFALFTKERLIVMSADKNRVMTPGPAQGVSPYFDRATAGEEGVEEAINSRGLRALFSYKSLKSAPWVLVAALPVEEAYAPIAATQKRIVGFMILVALLLAPIMWLSARWLLRPLLTLHEAIRRVRGDPRAAAEVPVRSRDEIGDLAADFNDLIRERMQAEASLRESEHRLRMITDNTPALIGYVDSDLRYHYANATYFDWFGRKPEEILGRTLPEILGKTAYAAREPHVHAALAGHAANFELPPADSGFSRHVHTRYVPDRRADGSVAGFYILASDVTALKKSEEQLRESERRLSLALEGSELALFDWNIETGEVFLSEQWAVMMGGKPELTRTTFVALEQITHPEDRPVLERSIRGALKGLTTHYQAEHRVRTGSGGWIWIQSHGQVTARDSGGNATRMVGTNANVTERKRSEQELAESRAELERAAWYDALTGLPNRNLLVDRLEQVLARSRRSRQLLALFYLDLDGFKAINDSMGHAAGDVLLKQFAERLRRAVRVTDTVARLSGDEFVILLEDLRESKDADVIANTIVEAAREEFTIESKVLHVTTCIGIAFTNGEISGGELLRRADEALYQAKRAGRDRYHIAQAEIADGARDTAARARH